MSTTTLNSDREILPVVWTCQLSKNQIVEYIRDGMKVWDKITAVLGFDFRHAWLRLTSTITDIEKNDEGLTMVSYKNWDEGEEFKVHISQVQWDLHASKVEKIVQAE